MFLGIIPVNKYKFNNKYILRYSQVSLVLIHVAVLRGLLIPVSFSANTLNSYSVASASPRAVNSFSLSLSLLHFFQVLSVDFLYSTQ